MMTTNASKTCLRHLAWLVVGLVSTALSAPWPAHAQPPSVHAQPMNYGAETRINAQAAARGPAFTGSAVSGLEKVAGGYRVRFTGCDIYTATAGTRAFEVHGEIRDKYNRVGGPNNLGLPVTDEEKAPDGAGRYNHFSADASIYWHPTTGPKIVRGAIRGGWANTYWEQGTFGYPISDEIGLPGGRAYGDFQNGVLYWDGGFAFPPMNAGLSKDQLATALKKIFEKRIQAKADQVADEFQQRFGVRPRLSSPLHIRSSQVIAVSDYRTDFWRSRNRIVTFLVTGWYDMGLLPDTEWMMGLNLLFYTEKRDGSTRFLVALAGGGKVLAFGIAPTDLAEGLRDEVQGAFRPPMDLGTAPKEIEVMSLKITSDGDLIVYIAPSSKNDILYNWKVDQVQARLNDLADGN